MWNHSTLPKKLRPIKITIKITITKRAHREPRVRNFYLALLSERGLCPQHLGDGLSAHARAPAPATPALAPRLVDQRINSSRAFLGGNQRGPFLEPAALHAGSAGRAEQWRQLVP